MANLSRREALKQASIKERISSLDKTKASIAK
jgi:hypothetical protein